MAKKRHIIRNSIKSFFQSHADPAKHDELEATRKDMEEKKLEILKIVQAEEPKDGSRRGPLTALIEDFHKQYESLYDHYDNLTGALKSKIHKQRLGKGNYSSSFESESDSDSGKSLIENGSQKGELEDVNHEATDSLHHELEEAKREVALLKNKLEVLSNEKETLESAYDAINCELDNTESAMDDLKVETETLISEKSVLLTENEGLNSRLEDSMKTEVDLKQQIEELIRERDRLAIEKEDAVKEIEGLYEKLSSSDKLLREYFDEKEIVVAKLKGVELEVETLESDNAGLKTETTTLRGEIQRMGDKIVELETVVQEKEEEYVIVQTRLEEVENESTSKISVVLMEISLLKLELEAVQTIKSELEAETEKTKQEHSEYMKRLEYENAELSNKIEEQLMELKDLEDVLVEKRELCEQLEGELQESKVDREATQSQLEKLARELDIISVTKDESVAELERVIEEFKRDVGMIMSISENVNNSVAGMESVNKKFEEENEKFLSRIHSMSEEIQILKHCVAGKNAERELLEEQLRNLTEQLQNEREHGLSVKQNLSKLEVEAVKDQEEKGKLFKELSELKKTAEELNLLLMKKNEQVKILADEKLEAIRQLCLWNDDVQSRYDELKTMVSKSSSRRGKVDP